MSSVTPVDSADNIRMDYLQLLTAQLANQNPLDPMDNDQMTQQLTMLSQLEQAEKTNKSLETMITNQEFVGKETLLQLQELSTNLGTVTAYSQIVNSSSLIGKEIEYYKLDEDNELTDEKLTGTVDSVTIKDGVINLNVGDQKILLGQIAKIED